MESLTPHYFFPARDNSPAPALRLATLIYGHHVGVAGGRACRWWPSALEVLGEAERCDARYSHHRWLDTLL